jgi:hypothetical protein
MKSLMTAVAGIGLVAAASAPQAQPIDTNNRAAAQALAAALDNNRRGQREDPVTLAARIKARQHYFGEENVNPNNGNVDESKVIISWFSVASFAVAARGRVFLLDSYIYRLGDTPGYVPTTVQELVDLRPEAIFIGHGHGDHADNAAYISRLTGAKIYGAAEHCTAFQADVKRIFSNPSLTVDCTALTSAGSAPGAEVRTVNAFPRDLCITSFKHVHSASVPVDPTIPRNPINPVRDPRVDQLFPPLPPPSVNTRTVAGAGGTVSIFYQFTVADSDFTFVWHDTAGPLKEQAPQVLELMRNLPKTDIQFGAGVSIGEANNGVRDIAMYIDALRPKVFYMTHTDNFNIGASNYYLQAINRQFEILALPESQRPDVRGLHDPYDYLRPLLATYEYKDPYWRDTRKTNRHSGYCRG